MSYEKIINCPACNSDSFQNHIIANDHLVSGESFVITKCNSCGLLITNPRPDQLTIGSYYDSSDYISHSPSKGSLKNIIYNFARFFTIRRKEKIARSFNGRGSILDLGCGTGVFLTYCKKKGWKISGIEPNEGARFIAKNNTQEDIYSDLKEITETKFDIISLWHVLEHVHDLQNTLSVLRERLSKKGRMLIAVPNHTSYDAEFYADQWAGWDVPRHLYHFNRKSMAVLTKNNHLKIEAILPMKLDSFYASLLSEQNGDNNQGYYQAFKTGLISNKRASKNNNYSSLIYIIKHQ